MCTSWAACPTSRCPHGFSSVGTANCRWAPGYSPHSLTPLHVSTKHASQKFLNVSSVARGVKQRGFPHLMFTVRCSYVVQIGSHEKMLDGCQLVCVKSYMEPECCPQYWGPLCLRKDAPKHTLLVRQWQVENSVNILNVCIGPGSASAADINQECIATSRSNSWTVSCDAAALRVISCRSSKSALQKGIVSKSTFSHKNIRI